MIRLGLQVRHADFGAVAGLASAAERAGYDSVWVADQPGRESYTLLGAVAVRTTTARLGALVTTVTSRHPAILAKQVTTLDVVSGGRAVLGIGAGSGVDLPPVGERMDRLEEALQICRAMFTEELPTFDGRYYRITGAVNRPAPVQAGGPPIVVGGQGEHRTLMLAARYADAVNMTATRGQLPRKLAALAQHCESIKRDRATISATWLVSAVVGSTPSEAIAARAAMEASTHAATVIAGTVIAGTPEAIAEEVLDVTTRTGLDGVILNFPANDMDVDAVTAVGSAVGSALGVDR